MGREAQILYFRDVLFWKRITFPYENAELCNPPNNAVPAIEIQKNLKRERR
jgi:hypothetical protein